MGSGVLHGFVSEKSHVCVWLAQVKSPGDAIMPRAKENCKGGRADWTTKCLSTKLLSSSVENKEAGSAKEDSNPDEPRRRKILEDEEQAARSLRKLDCSRLLAVL